VVQSPPGIELVRTSTRRVLQSIDELSDDEAHAPSRLPGWSRAEVVTHLARNADGVRGMVEAAARDEVERMYPGGAQQRLAGIEAGRDEPAATLRVDLRRSADLLTEAWNALPDDAWDRTGRASMERTMRDFVWVRWRELEVHHVDLDVGYESSDWPVAFISRALEEIFSTFALRSSPTRPLLDIDYRVVATDHARAWRVALHGQDVEVTADDDSSQADGEARGWGCDVVAWLYGRDPRGGGVVASGDLGVLRLPKWFPYA
jgi:maleylpyruvate isomerase